MRRALMWLNLYGREAVRRKLKNSLKTQKMHFLSVFELMPILLQQSVLPKTSNPFWKFRNSTIFLCISDPYHQHEVLGQRW